MMKLKYKSLIFLLMVALSVILLIYDQDDERSFTETQVRAHLYNRNTTSAKQVFYNMVPRCGSKSMRYLLHRLSQTNHFIASKDFTETYTIANYHISQAGIKNTARGLQSLKEPWIFTKHLNFINFTQFGFDLDPVYINIVRDPIDKLESHFYFRRTINLTDNIITYWGKVVADFFQDSDDADAHRRHNMTFDECIFNLDPECTDVRFIWTIIPHFCGQHYLCQTPTRNALNLAIKNVLLKFAVVGYVEKFIEFLEVLEIALPQFFKDATKTHASFTSHDNPGYRHRREFEGPKASEGARKAMMKHEAIKLEYEFFDFIKKRFKVVYESYTGRKLS